MAMPPGASKGIEMDIVSTISPHHIIETRTLSSYFSESKSHNISFVPCKIVTEEKYDTGCKRRVSMTKGPVEHYRKLDLIMGGASGMNAGIFIETSRNGVCLSKADARSESILCF